MSPETATPTNTRLIPASNTKKATVPVFVDLPAQPQAFPAAPAPRATPAAAAAAELIRAPHDASDDTASEAATADMGKLFERAAESPQAAAAHNALAAGVNENPHLRDPHLRDPHLRDPLLGAAVVFPEISVEITHEWVAVAAYYIWEFNGRQEGRALQDWLQAEGQFTDRNPCLHAKAR